MFLMTNNLQYFMLVALCDDLITHFLLTINACMCILYCIIDLTVHFFYGFASAKLSTLVNAYAWCITSLL